MTHSGTSEAILTLAADALIAVGHGGIALDDWLDRQGDAGGERRSLSSLLFTCYRKKAAIDRALAGCWRLPPQEKLGALLTAALTLAHYQTALNPASVVNITVDMTKKRFGAGAGRFANAVLRRALTALEGYDATSLELLPEAIRKRWMKRFGADRTAQLASLFQEQAPVAVRVRSGETLPGGAERIPLEFTSPWPFFVPEKCGELLSGEAFQRGAYYVQDPAPAAVMALAEPFFKVLPDAPQVIDLCSAPGGKLLMLAELLATVGKRASLVALDRSARRQKITAENLARCKVAAEVVTGDAVQWMPADGRKFDLVTADVPCSNSGVFRHRPDALWRWRAADLAPIGKLQGAILEHAAELTAPGGLLLYSTCSLEEEEDAGLIGRFLNRHPEFEELVSDLLLPSYLHDGAYAAVLRRKG